MRFHLVGLPHAQVTTEFPACAFIGKLRKFCQMMMARGHEVFLYAGEVTDAPCTELIACFTEADRLEHVAGRHYTAAPWNSELPAWQRLNHAAATEIRRRAQPDDFVCVTAGLSHKPIADALPDMTVVESGIGYNRTFAPYRVFESYAWMHMVYGAESGGDPFSVRGQWMDAVIPNAVDMAEFPTRDDGEGYYLFIGRVVERKGYRIAVDVCAELGERLVVAGPGRPPAGVRHVGLVGPKVRAHLMAGARAVFVPTLYVEPFGNVHVEAMACGTPVITTDWGVFTETVQQGITGFRCRTFDEFVDAARRAPSLDRAFIRDYTRNRFGLESVGAMYEEYFGRIDRQRRDNGGWAPARPAPRIQSLSSPP